MNCRSIVLLCISICVFTSANAAWANGLEAGFSAIDITPSVGPEEQVWLAGYGWGRAATGVHDPLFARCVVLESGSEKIALVSVDLIGLQLPTVQKVRQELADFDHVLVSSTHNHEGPDVIGIWGETPLHRGVNERYVKDVVKKVVRAVREADQRKRKCRGEYAMASDSRLLADRRLPDVKDPTLRVVRFVQAEGAAAAGIVVQWNCHPETLGSRNTLITADFPQATIESLTKRFDCPVVYFSGSIGGLMAPPSGRFADDHGWPLEEGDFAFAADYGQRVAALTVKALQSAKPIRLTPIRVVTREVSVPVDNPLYRAATLFRVLRRKPIAFSQLSDSWPKRFALPTKKDLFSVKSEVGCLALGELRICAIPGEIYPELVYGQFQDPVDPHADFPDAELEEPISALMKDRPWMIFGLANDEIGYILPKRQWDLAPPFAYGRQQPQYGEINSCSPEVARLVMGSLRTCVSELDRLSGDDPSVVAPSVSRFKARAISSRDSAPD